MRSAVCSYIELYRRARRRRSSREQYAEFQRCQASMIAAYLESRGVVLSGRKVVDIACGYGGYASFLAGRGAQVLALDLNPGLHEAANDNVRYVISDAGSLPIADGTIDFAFCASLLEHVRDPLAVLREIYRVLTPGALAYISYPPFYSPVGGHEFSPFHLMGERLAIWAYRRRRSHTLPLCADASSEQLAFSTAFGAWGLYPLTIAAGRKLIKQAGFFIEDVATRYLPISLASIPLIGEIATWHVQFLIRKNWIS